MAKKKSKSKSKPALQQRLAAVEVFEQTIVASVYTPHGPVRKIVEPADVVRMFMAGQTAVYWSDFTDRIVAAGIGADGCRHVLVTRKAKQTRIDVRVGKRTFRPWIRVPNLLAELVAQGDKWIRLNHVFAYSGTLTPKTALYVPPFPNMNSNGGICMGAVDVGLSSNVAPDAAFETLFFGSTFTDHLLSSPLRASKPYRNIWDAIKKTKGKVPFSVLKKVTTYGEFLKKEN
jgi:hypothetical protein